MRFCDLTLSYTETSGGIRTYIDQKRRYLLEQTTYDHVLIVPGEEDRVERGERWTTIRIASPFIPGAHPYRFFWRPDKILAALEAAQPDVIELGSFYVSPWPAFRYRQDREEAGELRPLVGGYFHTDIANAYVGAPLRKAIDASVGTWAAALAKAGMALANTAEEAMEEYVEGVFERCDLAFAASPEQAARLAEYGVDGVHVVPLGVDLKAYHPRHRSDAMRRELGAGPDDLLLVYGGRLDPEKHVDTLLDAFERLPGGLDARLVICGEGPDRERLAQRADAIPGASVRPYLTEPGAFARYLASADVYVTAGPHETFALSVVEAQASGLPVVGVRAGALPERVPTDAPDAERVGLLVDVDDAEAFARAIGRAAENRKVWGANARAHVEARYGWDRTFDTLMRLYEEESARQVGSGAKA
jgi:alpha-1,6-mannosyltransferase